MKKPKTETDRAICKCGRKFDRLVLRVLGTEVFSQRLCPDCKDQSNQKARTTGNQSQLSARKAAWLLLCPPRYRPCDCGLLPIPAETINRALEWRPSKGGRGLGLVGPAHIGKRRLLYVLAKDLHFADVRIAQISDFEFVRLGSEDEEVRSSARWAIAKARSAPVLILSDIGCERLTERAQGEFYSLIENRALGELPILWSTQFTGDQIAQRFANKNAPEIALARGRAAVDRLNENSDVIKVERKSISLREPTLLVQA